MRSLLDRRPLGSHLHFLAALAAAFLLIPAAAASAGVVTIVPEGSGSGVVENEGHGAVAQGEEVHCRWNGTEIVEFEPGVPSVCVGETFVEILEGYAAVRTADTGSEFGGAWVIEGGGGLEIGCGAGSATCTSSGSEFTMRVPFALATQPLTLRKTGTGDGTVTSDIGEPPVNCEPGCEEEETPVEEGATVILEAEADEFSSFTGWHGSDAETAGCDETGVTLTCEVEMDAAREVEAQFDALPTFALNLSTSGSGSGEILCEGGPAAPPGPSACAAEYPEGTELTLVAVEDPGSEFEEFTGDCSGATCEVTMDEPHSVGAIFNLVDWSLTIEEGGLGTGSVQCDTGSGPEACEATYQHGTAVTILATPGANSEVTGWSGCDAQPSATECEVEIDEDKTIEVTFDLEQRSLTVSTDGSGSGTVSCNGGTCAASYPHGTKVSLTADADSGSTFEGWSGACSGTGACVVTLEVDTTVTATFDKEPDDENGDDNGGSTPSPPPPPVPPQGCLTNPVLCKPGILIANPAAQVKGNKALLKVRCRGEMGARCRGVAKLIARVKVGKGAKSSKRRARNVVIGKSRYNLPTNSAVRILRAKLTRQGIRLVRRAGKRGLKVKLVGKNARNRVVKLKHRGGGKKRNRRGARR